jgi:hypothetical protein
MGRIHKSKPTLKVVLSSILVSAAIQSHESLAKAPETVGTVELGYSAVAAHKIQFGKEGTKFDYVKDGGQDFHSRAPRSLCVRVKPIALCFFISHSN